MIWFLLVHAQIPRGENLEKECVVHGLGREQKTAVVVVEAVGMWSGSVSVSCPHAHSHGGVQRGFVQSDSG